MNEDKISTPIKGAIGEFYVASFLSALGLVVALPRGGVPSSDLLVTTPKGHRSLALQVKTSLSKLNISNKYGNHWAWDVSTKAREHSEFHWYVFVNAYDWPSGGKCPDIYFVPSRIVSKIVMEWNDPNSSRLFFRIMEKDERDQYIGIAGFKKMADFLA